MRHEHEQLLEHHQSNYFDVYSAVSAQNTVSTTPCLFYSLPMKENDVGVNERKDNVGGEVRGSNKKIIIDLSNTEITGTYIKTHSL